MSSNSLSLTNVKDAIYNNLYLINEDGTLDNIRDIVSSSSGDLSGVMVEVNKKAPKENPEFTGTVIVPNNSFSQSKIINLTSDLLAKAPIDNPTLTGAVAVPGATFTGTGSVFNKIATFNAGVGGLQKSDVGLDFVNNTSDVNKPISTLTQAALNAKANLSGGAPFTGAISAPNITVNSGGSLTAPNITVNTGGTITTTNFTVNTGGTITIPNNSITIDKILDLSIQLGSKAPTASPTFTGTVLGITKAMVGLGNVDNTSDTNKSF